MSNLVQFPETYLIKDVRFWQIKIPTPLTTPLKPNSGFLDQNSNHINNQDSKEIIYLDRKSSFIFLSRQNGILVFSFWFLKKWMSFFQKHTLLWPGGQRRYILLISMCFAVSYIVHRYMYYLSSIYVLCSFDVSSYLFQNYLKIRQICSITVIMERRKIMGMKTYITVWIGKKKNINFLQKVHLRYKSFITNMLLICT